jgi:hypothetical protein
MVRTHLRFLFVVLLPLLWAALPACSPGSSGSDSSGTITPGGGGGGGGTPDNVAAHEVRSLTARDTGAGRTIEVQFTGSDSTNIDRYLVSVDGHAEIAVQTVTALTRPGPDNNSYTVTFTGLTNGTSYTFRVKTQNNGTPPVVSTGVTVVMSPGSAVVFVQAAPHGGVYSTPPKIVFNYDYTDANVLYVRYTVNGADPTSSSGSIWLPATGPITMPSAHSSLRYLLVRSDNNNSSVRKDVYEYYPGGTPRFFKFCGMRQSRVGHTATILSTSSSTPSDVAVIGGANAGGILNDMERYKIDFEHFEAGTNAMAARRYHAAEILNGGQVLVTGGQTGDSPTASTDTAIVYDEAGNAFVAAGGNLGTRRYFHTATRLYDGTVVIIGGMEGRIKQAFTALDNSSKTTLLVSGLWDASIFKGDLVEMTSGAAAGQVGTIVSITVTADPSPQSTFVVEGLVSDVLSTNAFRVIAGRGLGTAERYSSTGAALGATSGGLWQPRYGHTATELNDGTVLVAGGSDDFTEPPANSDLSLEIYDRTSRQFAPLGPAARLSGNRFFHTATKLKDGRVLIAGGLSRGDSFFHASGFKGSILSSAEIFDPKNQTTVSAGAMTSPRVFHGASLLNDGRILLVGGVIGVTPDGSNIIGQTADLFDPTTGTFTAVVTNEARGNNRCVTLDDGRVLVVGGAGDFAELFDPLTNRFNATAHGVAGQRTYGAAATALPDGRLLLTGGQTENVSGSTQPVPGPVLASAEEYSMSSIASTLTAGPMATKRTYHASVRLLDPTATVTKAAWHGKVLVVGGINDGGAVAACELYDPTANRFTATGSLKIARYDHRMTRLPNGRVLVTGGGTTDSPLSSAPLSSGEIYNPANGTWSDAINMMSKGRTQHAAVLLPPHPGIHLLLRGKVLILGGNDIDDASAELFNPATNRFETFTELGLAEPAMIAGRQGFAAVLRTYSRGLARFTNGNGTVTGFGTRWTDAAIPAGQRPQVGDLILCETDGTFYRITAPVAGGTPDFATLTLQDATTGAATTYQGPSTVGYQPYVIFKPDVFVAGGEGGSLLTDVFNGATGAFINAGDVLSAGRYFPTMDGVDDGRILVAGGYSGLFSGDLFVPNAAAPPAAPGVIVKNILFSPADAFIYHFSVRPPNGLVLQFRRHSAQVFFPN